MSYSTPKITIDLEEYNELIKQKDVVIGDEFVIMAKTVVASLLNNKLDLYRSADDLKRRGIRFYVDATEVIREVDASRIKIEKIKP